MTYQDTIDYLFSQLPMYQRQGKAAFKKDLTNIYALCKHNNNSHLKFKSIHIAGTNGKGSISHILASILYSAGYKVGLYTSPHLKDFRERIRIKGEKISEREVINYVEQNMSILSEVKPSFFEMSVAMAFDHFSKQKVDIAIVEVGMGGRLDSTNILKPLISVISNISFDHMQFLGNTKKEIASEKAGIIKKNTPVVIGETQDEIKSVFIDKAKQLKSLIFFADQNYHCDYSFTDTNNNQILNIKKKDNIIYKNLTTDLIGTYQKYNIITALKVIDIIPQQFTISKENIYQGLLNVGKNTGFKGRWQILSHNPIIIADTGHNIAGITEVIKQIKTVPYKQLHIIFGTVNDKETDEILKLLPKNAVYYFTKANIQRSMDETELQEKAKNYQLKGEAYSSVNMAFEKAKKKAKSSDMILICGSTFIVAEII